MDGFETYDALRTLEDKIGRRIDNTITNSKTIESLTEEAMVDKLTGFLNKARGTDRISKLCTRKTGSLMIMDLDSFKLVNDLFGHEMGDRVLKAFADIVRKNTRETDTISRIGGDEFMAFYEDLTDESAVASLTLRLNAQLSEEAARLMGEDHGIPLGISIGVVMVPKHGREYESLFSLADLFSE
ncbi:MAG: GGDEF domain-containing protein [Lachnospiraceae bacterium]|nr:GGDEF domain-containing protein [Lachnospiraceae bacterium]